jgi:NitT/TauT family transport system substrate-binding protein
MQTRRRFLAAAALASASGLIARRAAAEPPPEVTAVRLSKNPSICVAPQYVVEPLLRAEGFTDVGYVTADAGVGETAALARGDIHFNLDLAAALIPPIEAGAALTVLAGVHGGCFELFGNQRVARVPDLKGRRIAVPSLGSDAHMFASIVAAHVGLDPATDIAWITKHDDDPLEQFARGEVDAFLGFPPEPQMLRARKIGRVIVNSAVDRPWSQYFCCMLAANRGFAKRYPSATKRVVRAILKATDLCASEPALMAQRLVDGGFTPRLDYARQTLDEVPYAKWRDYDPEDTIRFYALRLHEARMIKASPQKIIADGVDLRWFNELKRELRT